jgi:hypothetical protein
VPLWGGKSLTRHPSPCRVNRELMKRRPFQRSFTIHYLSSAAPSSPPAVSGQRLRPCRAPWPLIRYNGAGAHCDSRAHAYAKRRPQGSRQDFPQRAPHWWLQLQAPLA